MADPTLAEMVEALRDGVHSASHGEYRHRIVDALTEIDRRLTALEGRTEATYVRMIQIEEAVVERTRVLGERLDALESAAHQHAPPENMGADVLRDALRLKTALDSCTWPITVDELARAVGLTPSRVTEVVIRSGLRHRWLVGWGPSTEGRAVTVHVGQGVTPIAGGLAYLGALPGVACVSPAGPVKVVRLDSTPAHLPTCGTAFRGCDPACPKDRAERET